MAVKSHKAQSYPELWWTAGKKKLKTPAQMESHEFPGANYSLYSCLSFFFHTPTLPYRRPADPVISPTVLLSLVGKRTVWYQRNDGRSCKHLLLTHILQSNVIFAVMLFLVQVQLGTEVLCTPSSTRLGFELMASRS